VILVSILYTFTLSLSRVVCCMGNPLHVVPGLKSLASSVARLRYYFVSMQQLEFNDASITMLL